MKDKKYLKLYEEWMLTGKIAPMGNGDYNGMCELFGRDELFILFRPTSEDHEQLIREGKCTAWWASDMSIIVADSIKGWSSFTPLRQNIVLFMAAINEGL